MKKNLISLRDARAKNKMEQFIREREDQPAASKKRFKKVLKSMASGTSKPKKGTSK